MNSPVLWDTVESGSKLIKSLKNLYWDDQTEQLKIFIRFDGPNKTKTVLDPGLNSHGFEPVESTKKLK